MVRVYVQTFLAKFHAKKVSLINKANGSMTEIPTESLRLLANTHFLDLKRVSEAVVKCYAMSTAHVETFTQRREASK